MTNPDFSFMLIEDYLDDESRVKLRDIALHNWELCDVYYQSCGKRGYFNLNDRYPEFSDRADRYIDEIMLRAGVGGESYSTARHFIGINIPTAFVTPHTDSIQFSNTSKLTDPVEIRFNTFLQRPEGGGVPVIGGTAVSIPEGCALAFNASVVHSSTPVEGETIRVVCSISAAVSSAACQKLLSIRATGQMAERPNP
jgi:hypothetical protein